MNFHNCDIFSVFSSIRFSLGEQTKMLSNLLIVFSVLIYFNQLKLSHETIVTNNNYKLPTHDELDFNIPPGNPKDYPCISFAHSSANQCFNSVGENWFSLENNEKNYCCFLLNYLNCLTSKCSSDDYDKEKRLFTRMRQNWLTDKCPNYYHLHDCSISKWIIISIVLTFIIIILTISYLITLFYLRNRRKKVYVQKPVESKSINC